MKDNCVQARLSSLGQAMKMLEPRSEPAGAVLLVVDRGNRGPVSTRAAFFFFLRARDLRFLVTLGFFFAGGGLPPPPRCQPSLSPSPPSSRGGAMPCGISGRGTSSSSSSSLRYTLAPIWLPGSAGGPPPSGRGLSYRTAARGVLLPFLGFRLRGRHFLPARRRVRRASAIAAILRRRRRGFSYGVAARGVFSPPPLAPVFMGVISFPLRPPSPPA